ncbi:MAG: prolipoprotein diacylglyceryl transferase [Limnochordales bacterium]
MAGGADVVGQLGPLPIYVFGLTTAVGFAVGTAVTLLQAERFGLAPARLFQAAPLVMVAGVLGGRVLYVLLHWPQYARHPLAVFRLPEGGFTFYGALLAGAGVLALVARRDGFDVWRALDAAAPGLALGQAIGLVGAQLPGRPTGVPWAVWLGRDLVHPIPAYGIILCYWLFFAVSRLARCGPARGRVFLVYLFLHGLGWTLIHFWSAGPRFLGLSSGQWAGMAAACAAASGFWLIPRRGPLDTVPAGRPAPPGGRASPPGWRAAKPFPLTAETALPGRPPGGAQRPYVQPAPRGGSRASRWRRAGVWLGGLAVLLGLYWMRWAS